MTVETITEREAAQKITEPLIFERSKSGRRGYQLPDLDVPEQDNILPASLMRDEIDGETEVSEVDVIRHFTRLSKLNFSIDQGLYPLGSCTMKHNPRINEEIARTWGFAHSHPLQAEHQVQGNLELLWWLEQTLKEIFGMPRVTLQPVAGAHGELTGILMVHKALAKSGNARKYILIPDSAHGTNPASAAFAGYQIKELKSNKRGTVDLAALEAAVDEDVAALMITVPNTLGLFESDIRKMADILHAKGAYLYCDGANLNSYVGVARPGDMGIDVIHSNLHKTFSTPHGGGGPGAGAVGVSSRLLPFMPIPVVGKEGDKYRWLSEKDLPQSIGRLSAFMGNAGVLLRAYIYMRMLGREGMHRVGEFATLNANYLMARLAQAGFDPAYPNRRASHEFIITAKKQKNDLGVSAMDIAKRLLDYGFHAPTTYFPLLVPECLLIEPTETESKEALDGFIDAMVAILKEAETQADLVTSAPHTMTVRRLDDVRAARQLDLTWKPAA